MADPSAPDPPDEPRPFVEASWLQPADILRTPDPEGKGAEALLAASNARRHEDATRRLGRIFTPVEPVVSTGAATVSSTVDVVGLPCTDEVWQALDDVLAFEDMNLPHLTFELTGAATNEQVDMRTSYGVFRPDVAGLASKVHLGAGMLLRWLDEYNEPLWRICSDLEVLTGVSARVSVLIVSGGPRPLPQAPIDADRIVAPLTAPLALEVVVQGSDTSRLDVEPGRAAIVPIGATTRLISPERNTILIFDVGRVLPGWLADLAASNAVFHPLMRADVPASRHREIHSYAGSLYGDFASFRSESERMLSSDAFDRASARARSELPSRPTQSLSSVLARDTRGSAVVRAPHSAGILIAEAPDTWFPVIAGLRLMMGSGELTALAPFLDGRSYPMSALISELGRTAPEPAGIVESLIELEVLEIVAP